MWKKKKPTHLEKSVANETIQLHSTNSEFSQVPSRWQGAQGWARSCSSQTPKQLANGQTTQHVSSASWQKDRKVMKGHQTDKQPDHVKPLNKSLPEQPEEKVCFAQFSCCRQPPKCQVHFLDPRGLPDCRLPDPALKESQAGLAPLTLLPQTFKNKSSTR